MTKPNPLYARAQARATRYLAALVADDSNSADSYWPLREAHNAGELIEFSMALGTIGCDLAREHFGDRAQDEMDRLAIAAIEYQPQPDAADDDGTPTP